MATIRVNMDKRSKGGAPVPDGDHMCQVVSIVEGESSQKKSPQLNVELEVVGGQFEGGRLLDFIPMTDASSWRVADFFYALGVDEPGESDVDTDSFAKLDGEGTEIQEQGALVMVRKVTQDEADQRTGEKRKRIRLYYSRVPASVDEGAPDTASPVEEEAPAPAPVAAAPKPAIVKKATAGPGRPPGKVKVKA